MKVERFVVDTTVKGEQRALFTCRTGEWLSVRRDIDLQGFLVVRIDLE